MLRRAFFALALAGALFGSSAKAQAGDPYTVFTGNWYQSNWDYALYMEVMWGNYPSVGLGQLRFAMDGNPTQIYTAPYGTSGKQYFKVAALDQWPQHAYVEVYGLSYINGGWVNEADGWYQFP